MTQDSWLFWGLGSGNSEAKAPWPCWRVYPQLRAPGRGLWPCKGGIRAIYWLQVLISLGVWYWESVDGALPSVLVTLSRLMGGPGRAFTARLGATLSLGFSPIHSLQMGKLRHGRVHSHRQTKAEPGLSGPSGVSEHGPRGFLGMESHPSNSGWLMASAGEGFVG